MTDNHEGMCLVAIIGTLLVLLLSLWVIGILRMPAYDFPRRADQQTPGPVLLVSPAGQSTQLVHRCLRYHPDVGGARTFSGKPAPILEAALDEKATSYVLYHDTSNALWPETHFDTRHARLTDILRDCDANGGVLRAADSDAWVLLRDTPSARRFVAAWDRAEPAPQSIAVRHPTSYEQHLHPHNIFGYI